MILVEELIKIMLIKGFTREELAKKVGLTPKAFCTKLKKGVLGSDEMKIIAEELHLKEPSKIFFAKSNS